MGAVSVNRKLVTAECKRVFGRKHYCGSPPLTTRLFEVWMVLNVLVSHPHEDHAYAIHTVNRLLSTPRMTRA